MAYEVVLDKFSGPLDLLLHLIRKQEVDIHDIPIAVITDQYLTHLHAMEEMSLEIASEFIVMAATLLAIKSRTLLPKPSTPAVEEEVDLHEQLIQQLLEYERCKWAAEQLRARQVLQSRVFSRVPLDIREFADPSLPPIVNVTLWSLVDSYRGIVSRLPKPERVAEIRRRVISVEEIMDELFVIIQRSGTCSLFMLIRLEPTKERIVSLFLALLELAKEHQIQFLQLLPFGDIQMQMITRRQEA